MFQLAQTGKKSSLGVDIIDWNFLKNIFNKFSLKKIA